MKNIVLIVPKGKNSAFAISGVSTIFRMAQSLGVPIQYALLSNSQSKKISINDFTLLVDGVVTSSLKADLVVVPSLVQPETALRQNSNLIDLLPQWKVQGTQIVSLCTGAYLLAAAGLLDGQEASSHCAAIDDLRKRFSNVHWKPEKIITDHAGVYTSGGTLSSFNVLIYIISKYFDKQVAHRIAKTLQLDYPRKSQKPFYLFSNQKKHADQQVLAIQHYFEQHLDTIIKLDQLARQFGLSRRSLNRRFKAATGDNPQTYLQKIKVEQAKDWLENENITINEVINRVGYNDANSFRKLFKRITGMLPNEYKLKFV